MHPIPMNSDRTLIRPRTAKPGWHSRRKTSIETLRSSCPTDAIISDASALQELYSDDPLPVLNVLCHPKCGGKVSENKHSESLTLDCSDRFSDDGHNLRWRRVLSSLRSSSRRLWIERIKAKPRVEVVCGRWLEAHGINDEIALQSSESNDHQHVRNSLITQTPQGEKKSTQSRHCETSLREGRRGSLNSTNIAPPSDPKFHSEDNFPISFVVVPLSPGTETDTDIYKQHLRAYFKDYFEEDIDELLHSDDDDDSIFDPTELMR